MSDTYQLLYNTMLYDWKFEHCIKDIQLKYNSGYNDSKETIRQIRAIVHKALNSITIAINDRIYEDVCSDIENQITGN